MHIKALLANELSKKNTLLVASLVKGNHHELLELISIMKQQDPLLSPRAAWAVDTCFEQFPELFFAVQNVIYENMPHYIHAGTKRQFFRMLTRYEVPAQYIGQVFDFCLTCAESPKEPVAVRIHAMQVMYNISEKEPGLKHELKCIFEACYEEGSSPGLINRSGKLIKKIDKDLKKPTYTA